MKKPEYIYRGPVWVVPVATAEQALGLVAKLTKLADEEYRQVQQLMADCSLLQARASYWQSIHPQAEILEAFVPPEAIPTSTVPEFVERISCQQADKVMVWLSELLPEHSRQIFKETIEQGFEAEDILLEIDPKGDLASQAVGFSHLQTVFLFRLNVHRLTLYLRHAHDYLESWLSTFSP